MNEKIKKYALRLVVLVFILLLIFSPYLLYIDMERYGLFVALLWVLSIAWWLWNGKQK